MEAYYEQQFQQEVARRRESQRAATTKELARSLSRLVGDAEGALDVDELQAVLGAGNCLGEVDPELLEAARELANQCSVLLEEIRQAKDAFAALLGGALGCSFLPPLRGAV